VPASKSTRDTNCDAKKHLKKNSGPCELIAHRLF
jgi:hypothetical protein